MNNNNNSNNNNNNNNKNSNDKTIGSIILKYIFIIFILIVSIYSIFKITNKIIKYYNTKYDKYGYPIETYDKNAGGLMDTTAVYKDQTPVLYDFDFCALGWQTDLKSHNIDITSIGNFYIVSTCSKNSNLYISYYDITDIDKNHRPPIGSNVTSYKMNKNQKKIVDKNIKKVSKNRFFKEYHQTSEAYYTMAIISENKLDSNSNNKYDYCNNENRWSNINLSNLIPKKYNNDGTINSEYKSPMYFVVFDSGYGYPSDWLRSNQFKNIMNNYGLDVDSEFWDRYNLDEVRYYSNINNDGDKNNKILKRKVISIDKFEIIIQDNNKNINIDNFIMNEKEFNEYINKNGWKLIQ